MKKRSELSSSKAGTAAWWPGLACSVSSREAKAPNSAGLEFRGTSSPSHCSRNSTGAGDQGRRLGEGFVAREAEDGGGAEVADRQSGVHRVALPPPGGHLVREAVPHGKTTSGVHS